jgi:steroid delta-isomerase-like uncharacterized protein
VESKNVKTVLAYLQAIETGDREALLNCLGRGYRTIDRTLEANAQPQVDVEGEKTQFKAWSDVHYTVHRAVDTSDGAVFIQFTRTGTLNGTWRSLNGTGQQLNCPLWEVFEFDADGRIVSEEGYYDLVAIRRQLGYDEAPFDR